MSATPVITPEVRALLALIQRQPDITAAVAAKESGHGVKHMLRTLTAAGLLHAMPSHAIHGRTQYGYTLSRAGARALLPQPATPEPPRYPTAPRTFTAQSSTGTYDGAELRPFAGRPGAMDAFALPTRHFGTRHYRDGRVERVTTTGGQQS